MQAVARRTSCLGGPAERALAAQGRLDMFEGFGRGKHPLAQDRGHALVASFQVGFQRGVLVDRRAGIDHRSGNADHEGRAARRLDPRGAHGRNRHPDRKRCRFEGGEFGVDRSRDFGPADGAGRPSAEPDLGIPLALDSHRAPAGVGSFTDSAWRFRRATVRRVE